MKARKIVYYVSTVLLTLIMIFSVSMYTFNYAEVQKVFLSLGYPAYIVIPLAIAKVLGLIAIWTGYSKRLREWAYAGFFFDFVLAFFAHVAIGDGEYVPALLATLFLLTSYFTGPGFDSESEN